MISVSIAINGEPIMARSAVNRLEAIGKYVCDDGSFIEHDPNDGAVALAIKLLQAIQDNPALLDELMGGQPNGTKMQGM